MFDDGEVLRGVALADALASVRAGEVGDLDLLELVERWEALHSWVVAEQARVMVELIDRTTGVAGGDPALELGAVLGVSPTAAIAQRAAQARREGAAGPIEALRFDAAVELLTSSPDGRAPAGRPLLQLVVPFTSLVGFDDAPGHAVALGSLPASAGEPLVLPAAVLRELAASCEEVERVLTDPVTTWTTPLGGVYTTRPRELPRPGPPHDPDEQAWRRISWRDYDDPDWWIDQTDVLPDTG
jgi:hypothetical protein